MKKQTFREVLNECIEKIGKKFLAESIEKDTCHKVEDMFKTSMKATFLEKGVLQELDCLLNSFSVQITQENDLSINCNKSVMKELEKIYEST